MKGLKKLIRKRLVVMNEGHEFYVERRGLNEPMDEMMNAGLEKLKLLRRAMPEADVRIWAEFEYAYRGSVQVLSRDVESGEPQWSAS